MIIMAQKIKDNRRAKGDGTVFQLKDGKWRAQITVGYKADGKPKKITRTVTTKSEAQAMLRQMTIEHATGKLTVQGDIKVKEYAPRWLKGKKPILKPKTYMDYECILRTVIIPTFGNITLSKLTVGDVNAFITDSLNKGVSTGALSKRKAILSNILSTAVIDGIINVNPVIHSMKVPKKSTTRKAIVPEDMEKILAEAERMSFVASSKGSGQSFFIYPVLMTAYHTGMREGEIFALRWENVDLDKQLIRVMENIVEAKDDSGKHTIIVGTTKTEYSNRTIKISQKLCDVLAQIKPSDLGNNDVVFRNKLGRYIAPSNFARVWRKLLKNIGMAGKYKFHEFRHTHATELAAQDSFSPASIRKRLGHSSVQTTLNVYTHAVDDEDERMANHFDK